MYQRACVKYVFGVNLTGGRLRISKLEAWVLFSYKTFEPGCARKLWDSLPAMYHSFLRDFKAAVGSC
jgi:hypothetical protein